MPLKQTDLGITPFSLFGGALKVLDEMKVRFGWWRGPRLARTRLERRGVPRLAAATLRRLRRVGGASWFVSRFRPGACACRAARRPFDL